MLSRPVLPSPPVLLTIRGRGARFNPANRFESRHVEPLPAAQAEAAAGPRCRPSTRVYRDATRSVINRVDSPDLGFRWTLNPYRGCENGCVYCYARPTHETLGFSCGLDFETRIVAKPDAPRLLRRELALPGWGGEPIVMSGVTDCYQPLEARLRITRGCLEVLAEFRQPVALVTKSRLVLRDRDLLAELAAHRAATVAVSLTTLDSRLAAAMEPRASCPRDRLRTIGELTEAGIPVSAMIAPVVPGLNDHEIPRLLEAAAGAGAASASWVMLRLPHQVRTLFLDWLHVHYPDRARRVASLIREVHDGRLYRATFGRRRRGEGPIAAQIAAAFRIFAARHGLDRPMPSPCAEAFRRRRSDGQMLLFSPSAA